MTATNFAFLQTGWPELLAEAQRAEAACHADPRTACFYARRTLELAVAWLYRAEAGAGGSHLGHQRRALDRGPAAAERGVANVEFVLGSAQTPHPSLGPVDGIASSLVLFFLPETYKRNIKHGGGFDDGKGSY